MATVMVVTVVMATARASTMKKELVIVSDFRIITVHLVDPFLSSSQLDQLLHQPLAKVLCQV